MTTSNIIKMATTTRGRIRVVVRTRPSADFANHLIEFPSNGKTVSVRHPGRDTRGYINNQPSDWSFAVDKVLHGASQEDVYDTCARDTVSKALDGFNGTVMAYGQTGAGKTFTMVGHTDNYRLRGVIPRAISHVFQEIRLRPDLAVTVRVSYVQIYNEVMSDLLMSLPDCVETQPLSVVENDSSGGVTVKGLSTRLVHNEEEALNLLFEGETNRAIAAHTLNKSSSRSHCVFTVHLESRSRLESKATYTVSKLNLVDLAGSERLSKTNSEGQTQKEAMYINKSLTFLEQVVIALGDRQRDHVPYRQSKLTHMLKDSLGGGCHTLLIANIWGEAAQLEETISTLRFASRMLSIASEPIQNVLQDPLLLLKQYEAEIKSLRQELAMHDTLSNRTSVSYEPLSEAEVQDIQRQIRQYLEGTLPEIELVSVRQIKETFSQFRAAVLAAQGEFAERVQVNLSASSVSHAPPERKTSKTPRAGKQTVASAVSQEVLVGDTDGTGFNLGVAPVAAKHPVSPVAATKKLKGKPPPPRQSISGQRLEAATIDQETVKEANEAVPASPVASKPDTPPPKEDAFEQFKNGSGSEIHGILIHNKDMLRSKRKELHEVSLAVNETKLEIDRVRGRLEQWEEARLVTSEPSTHGGQLVLQEKEYLDILELKKLKAEYRSQVEHLQQLRAGAAHCQAFVDQSRQRLVSEFESWYTMAFLGEASPNANPSPRPHECISKAEEFDKLQQKLLPDDTLGFYRAWTRTDMRTNYPSKRQPGSISTSVRNKPPSSMAVS